MKPLKKISTSILMTILLIFITCFSAHAAAWEKKAKSYFEDDYYSKCIDVVKPLKDNNFARMFLAFSQLQEYKFNNTEADEEKFNNTMAVVVEKTTSDDLINLLYFVNQKDKPFVVDEARNLLKGALKNCNQNEDMKKLLPMLQSSDEPTREMAMKAVKDIITPKRKMVDKGGTLRPKDIEMMTDPDLIKGLLENVEGSSVASQILVMIEKPVLKYLSAYEGKKVMQLEAKITKSIAKREKNYPESNWYSATGKTR